MLHKHLLDNGIRIVAEELPSVRSATIGLWVNVGSRDEAECEHGLSHFLEHMFFKGTKKRTAKEIALEIDGIGGELNAFTSRENTTFYAKVLDEDLSKAIDILSDNFHSSCFDPAEIEKEKQVVLEEIKMVEDDPEDLVHELHLQAAWKGSALARSILGTPESVSAITREKILAFVRRRYDPKQILISVAGRFEPVVLMRQLESAFGKYAFEDSALRQRQRPALTPRTQVKNRSLEQAHLCIGTEGISYHDPDRYALGILNTALGGGMSSRLFQEVREEMAWAYTIYSSPSSYQDGGLFTVYAASSVENLSKVIGVVLKQFKSLKDEGLEVDELARAKSHMIGSMMLSMESTGSRMSRIAKEELHFQRSLPLKEIVSEINQVSLAQVQALANRLFRQENLSLTALGGLDQAMIPEVSLA